MKNKNNSPETKPILDIKRKDASCVLDKSQDTIINEILVSEDIIILDNYNNMQLKKLIKKALEKGKDDERKRILDIIDKCNLGKFRVQELKQKIEGEK